MWAGNFAGATIQWLMRLSLATLDKSMLRVPFKKAARLHQLLYKLYSHWPVHYVFC